MPAILVISHTNAAINEIKARISSHCKHLFGYPNFVGTIQSFVDEFLAIPYFKKINPNSDIIIDNDRYYSKHFIPRDAQAYLKKHLYQKDEIIYKSKLIEGNLSYLDGSSFPLKDKTSSTYKAILAMKQKIRKEGILSFEDAYILANEYILALPNVIDLIRARFQNIFVDEMQDMDTHQYKLLEDLFFENTANINYQRIGDKNQAIFNGDAKDSMVWVDREKIRKLNGSHRLNQNIAKVVEAFALYPIQIRGECVNTDGSLIDIKPIIIVYDNSTKTNVIHKFSQRIKKLENLGALPKPKEHDYPYHAISWNKEWKKEENANDNSKLRLIDFFPKFTSKKLLSTLEYDSLEDYLLFCKLEDKNMRSISDNIYAGLLKILRLEKIKTIEGKYYTKHALIEKIDSIGKIEEFRESLFTICLLIAKGRKSDALLEIRRYTLIFCAYFDESLPKDSVDFINTSVAKSEVYPNANSSEQSSLNVLEFDGIKVNIGTVHSVKGRTHTATLYLESYFQLDGKGLNAKSYESQRLVEQFKGNKIDSNLKKRGRQSTKMVYVGFSRPTHLLCFAVHKDRFDKENFSDLWEIDQSLVLTSS
ncbi:MAG: UvrD-helicase domain-containing protein [Patescibacteria group bacterium]